MAARALFPVLRIVSFMNAKIRQGFQTVESALWAEYCATAHNPVRAWRNGTGLVILGESFFRKMTIIPKK